MDRLFDVRARLVSCIANLPLLGCFDCIFCISVGQDRKRIGSSDTDEGLKGVPGLGMRGRGIAVGRAEHYQEEE